MHDKTSTNELLEMLKQPGMMDWIAAPQGTMKFAAHLHKTGTLKTMPKAWTDYYLAEAADLRETDMKDATREKLKNVSVATLTTALFKRGLRNQFIQDTHPLNPSLGNMVGEAFTLRYIPAREDLNPITVFKDRSHPQRKAVEECPAGGVMVIDSRKDPRAASAGSILVARLMKRGVAGIVTDG